MIIETDRLTLRPYTMDDLDDLAVIRAKPEVMRYINNGQTQNREQVAERLRAYLKHYEQHGFSVCAVIHRADARLIGGSGLFTLDRTPEIEVGYTLDQPYWGQGLATEAAHAWLRYGFEEVGLDAIAAVAYPENQASRHVMEKLGLTYRKNGTFYGGEAVYYRIERIDFKPSARLGYRILNDAQTLNFE